jgi:hypothetical protein
LCRCSAAGGCAAKTKPRWRIGHVQAVRRSRGRGAAVHHAGRNSGASGSRQRGFGAAEATGTAGCRASTACNSTRRSARALDGSGCSTTCDRRANPSTRRSFRLRRQPPQQRRRRHLPPQHGHQTRRPPPHKPSRKRRSAAMRVTASTATRIIGEGRSIFGTRVSGGRSNRSAIAPPARNGARIITGPSGADRGTIPDRVTCLAATNSEQKRYCGGSGQPRDDA